MVHDEPYPRFGGDFFCGVGLCSRTGSAKAIKGNFSRELAIFNRDAMSYPRRTLCVIVIVSRMWGLRGVTACRAIKFKLNCDLSQ